VDPETRLVVASLWDVHVDDLIPSRNYGRVHYGEV
jgi:hypothetical protein